ncbi:hypothetical protein JX266_010182 [Neoarthrinium moseri]|nr:hypothetical protein JX266_010182 [Neoarthrinium moseri]
METPTALPNSTHTGPPIYLSTSEEGRTPATVITIGAVFSALAVIATALRFYCRAYITRAGFMTDDWLMLAACFLTVGMGVMLIVGGAIHALAQPTIQGWGPTDYFWITDDAEVNTEKIFWVFIMVQDVAFGLVKLSILCFYRRIFPSKVFRALNTTLIVITTIWTVGFFFAYMFRCGTNFWALWAPLQYLIQYCYDSTAMFYTLAISDVATDVFILSLPLFWLFKLNMTPAKRLAVSGVFLLGFIEIGTGITRLVYFVKQTTNYIKTADGIGLLTTLMFWSMVEMGIAVVAGCLPTIWPLISKISVEEMVRSVRSALSLESLRDLARVSSKGRSRPDDQFEDYAQDAGPYFQFSESIGKRSDRDISAKTSHAEHEPKESVALRKLNAEPENQMPPHLRGDNCAQG